MTMALYSFPAQYDDDIQDRVFDGIGGEGALWPMYVNISSEKKLTLSTTGYSGFAVAGQWKDGTALPMDGAQKIFDSVLTMVRYGMGFKISRMMADYGEVRIAQQWAKSLSKSVNQAYEVNHAALLNAAFTTTYTSLGGVALLSASHTTAGSATRSNLLATSALTPANLATIKVRARNWNNYRGLNDPISLVGAKLIHPPDLDETADKMFGSVREPFTADNDKNTNAGRFIDLSVPYITSTTAWFLQASDHGLLSNHGMGPSPINFDEPATESIVHGVKFDFVCAPEVPDGMFGSQGA